MRQLWEFEKLHHILGNLGSCVYEHVYVQLQGTMHAQDIKETIPVSYLYLIDHGTLYKEKVKVEVIM